MANNNRNDDDRGNRGSDTSGSGDGSMSVREAGQKGGEIGGQRVRELIEEGKQAERDDERGGGNR